MHIGIDFDNTIVCYDDVFYKAALEKKLIPERCAKSKNDVRQFFRDHNQEEDWTRLQGFVYGCCMSHAKPYDGVLDFLNWAKKQNEVTLSIISHKTQYPVLGPRYNLREAAIKWIKQNLFIHVDKAIFNGGIHFHEKKEEKIKFIGANGCTHFIDDLPDILTSPFFPVQSKQFLFDPKNMHDTPNGCIKIQFWDTFKEKIEAELSS